MNPILTHFPSYCKNPNYPLSSLRTIEEGLQIASDILQQKILCHHDITHLNKVYQTVDQLEKKMDIIPDQNSSTILSQIDQKIQLVGKESLAEQIISAYNLQQFEITFIDKVLTPSFTIPILSLEKAKEIAECLPFCGSQQTFDTDVTALLGTNQPAEITAILSAKKDQPCKYTKNNKMQQRQKVLGRLRKQNPSLYPSYLDEILDGGFFHLYDHLITMKKSSTRAEKNLAVKMLSFSSFAHIILEFREITLAKLEKQIPTKSNNIVFLLGNTGSGKSTTFCYLREYLMIIQGNIDKFDTDKDSLIGNDSATSCTLLPNIAADSNRVLIDFPGFKNTHGQVISMAIELTLKALVKKYSPKIILIIPKRDVETALMRVRLLGEQVKRILGSLDHCIVGLTQYPPPHNIIEKQQQDELAPPNIENLQILEGIFKKIFDLNCLIPFIDLTNQKQLEDIFEILESQEKIDSLPMHTDLDIGDKNLMRILFKNNLMGIIREKKNRFLPSLDVPISYIASSEHILTKNINMFEQSIFKTSFLNTILTKSYPEIGKFFHLEGMDPTIVRACDKEIIGYIDEPIQEAIYNFILVEKIIRKNRDRFSQKLTQYVDRELTISRKYLSSIYNLLDLKIDPKEVEEKWNECLEELQQRFEKENKDLKPLELVKDNPHTTFGIPYGISARLQRIKSDKIAENFFSEIANKLCQNIKVYMIIIRTLENIKNYVKKRDHLDKMFFSYPIPLDSVSSLKQSIEKQITLVKNPYGGRNWEDRIEFLIDQFSSTFSSIRSNAPVVENILYALISQKVSHEKLPPYLKEVTCLTLIHSFLFSQKNYLTALDQLASDWGQLNSLYLQLKNPGHFFHISLVTEKEYHFLLEKGQQLFEQYDKTPFTRLLLVAAIDKLLKKEPSKPKDKIENPLIFSSEEDRNKILQIVRNSPWILEYSKEWLRKDKKFILAAVQYHERALLYANEKLKNDRSFVLSAVQKKGRALYCASELLKNDRDVVLAAVQQNGIALQFASELLKNDRDVVLAAIQQNRQAFYYASRVLQEDPYVILAATK